jgi:hypothetical protein
VKDKKLGDKEVIIEEKNIEKCFKPKKKFLLRFYLEI